MAAPPPPPGSGNATPIDTGIWLVLIIGSLVGSYYAFRSSQKTTKAE
jgi:hypothetical protein